MGSLILIAQAFTSLSTERTDLKLLL